MLIESFWSCFYFSNSAWKRRTWQHNWKLLCIPLRFRVSSHTYDTFSWSDLSVLCTSFLFWFLTHETRFLLPFPVLHCIAAWRHGDCTALFVKPFRGPLKPSFHSKEASVSEFLVERYGLRSFAAWQKTDKQNSRKAETDGGWDYELLSWALSRLRCSDVSQNFWMIDQIQVPTAEKKLGIRRPSNLSSY